MDADLATAGPLFLAVLGAGLFAGFIAGLFGIGGGIVIVPALYAVFGFLDVDPAVRTHLAIGTSLSVIAATSWRAVNEHRKLGAVDGEVLRSWGPWIALGAIFGAAAADGLPGHLLTAFFAGGALLVAVSTWIRSGRAKKERVEREPRDPSRPLKYSLAAGTGFLSSIFGIGGGVFGIVLLTRFGHSLHRAVGTSSGFGIAIATPGALGFIVAGWTSSGLPVGSLGYVNLIGFASIAAMSMLTAPLGARAAHRLDKTMLSRTFAGYLALTSLFMMRDAINVNF